MTKKLKGTYDGSKSKQGKKGKAKRKDESEKGYMERTTFTFRKERGEEAEIPSTRGNASRKGGEGVKGDQLPHPSLSFFLSLSFFPAPVR